MNKTAWALTALVCSIGAAYGLTSSATDASERVTPLEVFTAHKRSPDGETVFVVNLYRAGGGAPLLLQGITSSVTEDGFAQVQDSRFDLTQMAPSEIPTLSEGDWTLHVAPAGDTWGSVTSREELLLVFEEQ